MSSWPRRPASSAFTAHLTLATPTVAPFAPRARRDRPAARRRRRARARSAGSTTSATASCRSRATTWSRGLTGPTSGTGSRGRWSPCSTAARPIVRPAAGGNTLLSRGLPLGGRPDRRRSAARAGGLLDRAWRRVERAVRQPQPRDADRGRARRTSTRTGAGWASTSATRGRASVTAARSTATACGGRPSRPRPSVRTPRRTARRRRSTTRRRSSSSPTACRSCWPREAPSPRCTAAGGRWRAGSSTRACGAARGRRVGSDHGRARPQRPRLLLRGLRRGPRAVRGLRRAARPEPRHRRGRAAATRGARRRGPRRRPVHDLLRARRSSPIAATRASPAARRGSCAAT